MTGPTEPDMRTIACSGWSYAGAPGHHCDAHVPGDWRRRDCVVKIDYKIR